VGEEQRYSSAVSVTGKRQTPAALPPEKNSDTHCTGDWVGPPIWTGAENLAPHKGSTHESSSPWLVAIPTKLVSRSPLSTAKQSN
jgi:hypothetical protein